MNSEAAKKKAEEIAMSIAATLFSGDTGHIARGLEEYAADKPSMDIEMVAKLRKNSFEDGERKAFARLEALAKKFSLTVQFFDRAPPIYAFELWGDKNITSEHIFTRPTLQAAVEQAEKQSGEGTETKEQRAEGSKGGE